MEINKTIKNKNNLIIFDNQEIINKTDVKIKDNHLFFNQENEFFVVLNNFDQAPKLKFEIAKGKRVKLYLLSIQSRKTKIEYQIKVNDNSELTLFTDFSSSRNTSADISLKIDVYESAKLKILNSLIFNGKLNFIYQVNLKEKNARADIELLNIGKKTSEFIVDQKVNHLAVSTVSNINNWLIATDDSKFNFSVTGKIEKGMEYSKCHQSNKGIMLSDKSEISVIPQLLIDEYDVDASHGAAIGQMDELQLYYLLSRGLSEKEARELIISGYTSPFIQMIEDSEIQKLISSKIKRAIRGKTNNG